MRSSSVSINLKKDQILIKLNENAEQKNIVEALKKKLPELKKLYKEEKTPIKVTGKQKLKKLKKYKKKFTFNCFK